MSTVVTALHILVCLFLMLTVLLQQGKGGGMGGAFGGSNAGTVFGGAGASGFLRRLTAIAATVFMVTSMVLAFFASADAGDSLEKFSKEEAKRKKQANEAQLRLYDGDGGVAPDVADAGVMTIDPAVVPMVAVAFSQRRKILRHTLGAWISEHGIETDFDLQRRAEEVPVADYLALAALKKAKGAEA